MKNIIIGIGTFIAIIGFVIFFPWFGTSIKTYESGVRLDWGKVADNEIGEGFTFYNPIKTNIKKIDMRERKHTISTNTVSKEGLAFGVQLTVRYQVKPGQAVYLVSNLQTELNELIMAYANSTIDDIATGKDKNEMYSDKGRVEIVQAVKDKLNNELGLYAQINQVIFENISLPASITEAIQKQQAALETIKEKENMQKVAEKEAEIRRIEARGIADANKIIQQSLTTAYLQYEAIQKLNPEAQIIYVPTSGLMPVLNITK